MRRRRKSKEPISSSLPVAFTAPVLVPVPMPDVAPLPTNLFKRLRGETLGISAGSTASLAVLDGCVDLGVKWVRVSHESGWSGTLDALAKTVDAAHSRGLKVMQVVQNSGKDYSDPARNKALVSFSVESAQLGCDSIEIGNEWNHAMFWKSPPLSATDANNQAKLSLEIARAIRLASPNTPIVSAGMSPEANNLNPWIWWPEFLDADIPGNVAVNWDGIGLHPYVYPELATTNPFQWNPLKQVPNILTSSVSRGVSSPIWITEVGAPGFDVNGPIIRGIQLTEARQAECYRSYVQGIKSLEAINLSFPLIAFATLFDGQSATNAVEQGLGLIRKDGTKKEAWGIVRAFALEDAPVVSAF